MNFFIDNIVNKIIMLNTSINNSFRNVCLFRIGRCNYCNRSARCLLQGQIESRICQHFSQRKEVLWQFISHTFALSSSSGLAVSTNKWPNLKRDKIVFSFCHVYSRGQDWVLGNHAGLLLSCSDHISKNVTILSNKLWSTRGQPVPNSFTKDDLAPRDKSHGFVSLTFTRY